MSLRRHRNLLEPMVRQRVRIRFSKSGNLKYIGHKDLLRFFESLFRRARLPLAMSGGYHPKIRMSFPSALALGIEGFDEVLELELTESVPVADSDALLSDLLAKLNDHSIDGIAFLSAQWLSEGAKKARLFSSIFEMLVPEDFRDELNARLDAFISESSVLVEKSNGKTVDVRKAVFNLQFAKQTGQLTVEIKSQDGPEAGIRELLQALNLEQELFRTVFPRRTCCRLTDDPLDRLECSRQSRT